MRGFNASCLKFPVTTTQPAEQPQHIAHYSSQEHQRKINPVHTVNKDTRPPPVSYLCCMTLALILFACCVSIFFLYARLALAAIVYPYHLEIDTSLHATENVNYIMYNKDYNWMRNINKREIPKKSIKYTRRGGKDKFHNFSTNVN